MGFDGWFGASAGELAPRALRWIGRAALRPCEAPFAQFVQSNRRNDHRADNNLLPIGIDA